MLTSSRPGPLRTLALWGPVVAYMALIFYLSSLSSLPVPLPPTVSDKQAHSFGYLWLGLLMLRAVARGRWQGVSWRTAVVAILLATAYGVSDEFHQSFVPGRDADVHDVMADAAGATVGAALVWAWGIIAAVRARADTR